MPHAIYSQIPPKCGQASEVVTSAFTGSAGNRALTRSSTAAEYCGVPTDSITTMPSGRLTGATLKPPGSWTSQLAISIAFEGSGAGAGGGRLGASAKAARVSSGMANDASSTDPLSVNAWTVKSLYG